MKTAGNVIFTESRFREVQEAEITVNFSGQKQSCISIAFKFFVAAITGGNLRITAYCDGDEYGVRFRPDTPQGKRSDV